jgi:hypothetical protein
MAVAVFDTSESLVTVRGRSFRRYVYMRMSCVCILHASVTA